MGVTVDAGSSWIPVTRRPGIQMPVCLTKPTVVGSSRCHALVPIAVRRLRKFSAVVPPWCRVSGVGYLRSSDHLIRSKRCRERELWRTRELWVSNAEPNNIYVDGDVVEMFQI